MTWRTWMEKYLTDRGLWPKEAMLVAEIAASSNEVIGGSIDPDSNEIVGGIFDRSQEGYPPAMSAIIAISLDREALEYIDANKPKHFARPMFLSERERRELLSKEPQN